MNLLVIGGSYFYGRVFVMEAVKEHTVTVLNRGTYSMKEFGVKEIRGDRHDVDVLMQCRENYDAVIDFCAYDAGDVERIVQKIAGQIGQYVLISTVDAYERGNDTVRTEDHALEHRIFPGEAGAYIAGKVALEEEVVRVCGERCIPWTVLRPAILYGPYNYAPRESVYIRMMLQNRALPSFVDADGRFQLVYVKDAAQALLRTLGNTRAYGQAYNLCQDGSIDYALFFQILKEAAEAEVRDGLQEIPITVDSAMAQQIPVPFPAKAEETQLCSNEKSKRELSLQYTDLAEGMGRTYRAFKQVYQPDTPAQQ